MGHARRWTAIALLFVALGAYSATHLTVESDITHFLPSGHDDWAARVSKALASSSLGKRMVLSIGGGEPAALVEASQKLSQALRAHPEIEEVRNGVDRSARSQIFDLYFDRRFQLYSETPEAEYRKLLSEAGLAEAAARLRAQLGGLTGAMIRPLAPRDPLLAFPRLLGRLDSARQGGLKLEDGVFLSHDSRYAILFVSTRASPFAAPIQRNVLSAIASEFSKIKRAIAVTRGQALSLEQSGVNRYAVAAEASIRSDVQRVGTVSIVAIVLLFVVIFRSLRALLLSALPLLLGILTALAVTLLLLGSVHGATLAFGATLIGVCLDYPVHLLCHHTLGTRGRDPRVTLREIWPAVLLGALTTLAGLLGLGSASFPGIREMALFTGVGVMTALLATRFAVAPLLGPAPDASPAQRRLAASLTALLSVLRERRGFSVALLGLAFVLCALGLPKLRFQDDMAGWVPAPEALRAEDDRVRKRVMASDPGQLAVVMAQTRQQALERNDRVARALGEAQQAGELGGYSSLHALLFSESLQRKNHAALSRDPDVGSRVERAFEAAGFAPDAFLPFAEDLERPFVPLRLDDLERSALSPLVSGFLLEFDARPAVVTYLRDVEDKAAVVRRLEAIEGARYFDQRALLRTTYSRFRERTLLLIGVGLLAVWTIALLRYRSFRLSLGACLPAMLAAGGALSSLSLVGVTIDLFHVVGLLLVLSIGVDYGIFLVETSDEQALPATLLALLIACCSTILAFGLLAMSSIPALRSLGQVIGVGVLLALLWSPVAFVVALPRRASAP